MVDLSSMFAAGLGTFYQDGSIVTTRTAINDEGYVVVLDTYTVPIRYQLGTRTVTEGGVQRKQAVMRVLQAPLRAQIEARGLTGVISPSDDLDAQLIDRDGNRYEAGAASQDSGGALWVIDVTMSQAANPAPVRPPATYLVKANGAYLVKANGARIVRG
jgi:hypothetical protein